jgi:transcriptional regulator with XRE-family HTH domain
MDTELYQVQTKKMWGVLMLNYAEWFAARLRSLLGEMTQTDLIVLMRQNGYEMKAGRLSHYMQGRNYPDPDVLAQFAKAFEVSADYILGLTEETTPVEELKEQLAAARGNGQVDKIISRLTKEQREQVLGYAEYLAAQNTPVLTQREREQEEILVMLKSVEKLCGRAVRLQIEQSLRGRGLPLDNDQ